MGSHRASGPDLRRRRRLAQAPRPGVAPQRRRRAHAAARGTQWSAHLPRAAVLGALGIALVAAPVVGPEVTPEAGASGVAEAVEAAAPPAPAAEPLTPALRAARASWMDGVDFRVAPESVQPAALAPASVVAQPLPVDQLLALRADAEHASRTHERARLDGCSGEAPPVQPANGEIDAGELCVLWDGEEMLRADAAVALAGLNSEYFAAYGADMCITDSYRSYAEQVAVRRQKPGLAARPGTSQHGWGLAVDVCDMQGFDGAVYTWLRANAPAFGWDNPEWARAGGSGPNEPWHWEYVAGQPAEVPVG